MENKTWHLNHLNQAQPPAIYFFFNSVFSANEIEMVLTKANQLTLKSHVHKTTTQ
jgi:hypothetical protein